MAQDNPFVIIRGIVIGAEIFTPDSEKSKPYIKVEVLQVLKGAKSQIIPIKDYNLNSVYNEGESIEKECIATMWSFNNRSGFTLKVFNGEMKDISYQSSGADIDLSAEPDHSAKNKKPGLKV